MIKDERFGILSDEMLMTYFLKEANQQCYTELYRRYFKPLVKYLIWLGTDAETSSDIVQNIFIKIYLQPHLFDVNREFKVWIFSIAKNHWKNDMRRQSNRTKLHLSIRQILPNVEIDAESIQGDKLQKVRQAINLLPEDHKEVILLKYSSHLTIKEIAGVMDCKEGTVKSRLFYALKKLQKLTKDEP